MFHKHIYRVARQHCPVFKWEFDPLTGVDSEIRLVFQKIQIKTKISMPVPNYVFFGHHCVILNLINVVKINFFARDGRLIYQVDESPMIMVQLLSGL